MINKPSQKMIKNTVFFLAALGAGMIDLFGEGPYHSNYSDQNSVKIPSEIIRILLAFLESKWKKPGKTTSWTPTKMKKM